MEVYIGIYLLLVNVIGWLAMYSDKKRAIRKKYRISEKKLFLIAIVGGSVGTTLGMYQFRHKTKHWYFKLGMPLIFLVQVVLVGYLVK